MASYEDTYVPFDPDYKDGNGPKNGNKKLDCELFHEEDDVVEKMIRVKRIGNGATEKWRVYEDAKVVLTVPVAKLTHEEAAFMRTVDGLKFVIELYKKSVVSDIDELKAALDAR